MHLWAPYKGYGGSATYRRRATFRKMKSFLKFGVVPGVKSYSMPTEGNLLDTINQIEAIAKQLKVHTVEAPKPHSPTRMATLPPEGLIEAKQARDVMESSSEFADLLQNPHVIALDKRGIKVVPEIKAGVDTGLVRLVGNTFDLKGSIRAAGGMPNRNDNGRFSHWSMRTKDLAVLANLIAKGGGGVDDGADPLEKARDRLRESTRWLRG